MRKAMSFSDRQIFVQHLAAAKLMAGSGSAASVRFGDRTPYGRS